MNFSLPTADQWKYAAKGGNKSQNFTYSGSNTPGDVAWYSENTSTRQNVKTKAPNELGIYDMSGNVSEYTYLDSTSKYRNCYGGDYTSKSNDCTTSSYFSDYYDSNIGFRLILTFQ